MTSFCVHGPDPCLPDTHALTLQQNSLEEGEPPQRRGGSLFPRCPPDPTLGQNPEGDPLAWAPEQLARVGSPTLVFPARGSPFGPGTGALDEGEPLGVTCPWVE